MHRFFVIVFFILGCSDKKPNVPPVDILAKIDEKIITLEDFYNRAEYTIRPLYCRGDLYIHKKIILNNLIAEKLLSLEAESNGLGIKSEALTNFLKGRKEQAMRKVLYFHEGYKKVELENKEIAHYYKMAGRIYDVNYFSYPKGSFADSLKSAIDQGHSLEDIYLASFDEKIPRREVKWEDSNDPLIDKWLFNNKVQKGEILGPILLNDDSYFIMQINGWTDQIDLSDTKSIDRVEKVNNVLKERKGIDIYRDFIAEVMKGVKLDFNKDIFDPYSRSIGERFFRTKESKETALSNALFNSDELLDLSQIGPLDDIYNDLILYSINGKGVTVKEFEHGIASHPLVFRNKKMDRSEFPKQFQLAIVDYIQDIYLTQKAYDLEIDKTYEVQSEEQLWLDSFKAFQYATFLNKELTNSEPSHIELRPYIDNLQDKYDGVIKINMELFESIQLSKVDMFVTQGNVPYPVVVPNFPSYTDDSYLDYGAKIER